MTQSPPVTRTIRIPTKRDMAIAKSSSRALAKHSEVKTQLEVEGGEKIFLPAAALPLLQQILSEMARGHTVTLTPVESELTTQQAAQLLHVSRPFLIKLLESGEIPFRKVGSHRRVMLHDVIAYKRRIDQARHAALQELVDQAQELGMGYDE
jgi:excisionase family DNA binding protein